MTTSLTTPQDAAALAQQAAAQEAVLAALALQKEKYSDKEFLDVGGEGFGFLPLLQLHTANSDTCKTGKIAMNHFGLKKNQDLIDLGKTTLAVPLAWRSKAMNVSGEKPLAFHNASSPEFKAIREKAESGEKDTGCMFGPEFLVWMGPEHGYALFFCGSATSRNESASIRPFLPGPNGQLRTMLLDSDLIVTDKYKWQAVKIKFSSQQLEGPPADTLVDTITKFLSPKDSVIEEKAPEGTQLTER